MSARKTVPLLALLATASLVPLACGKDPVVPAVGFDGGFGVGFPEGGAPLGPSADPMATAEAGAPSASVPPSASVAPSAAPSAAASAVNAALDLALDTAINQVAAKDAPGMAPEGEPGRATLQPNEHFNMLVNMVAGKCYTVVALSAPLQVTQLEAKLLTPPLYNVEAGKSGASDKNPAVIGRGAQKICPLLPVAIPYKVDVAAKAGAGRILVRVYSKSK